MQYRQKTSKEWSSENPILAEKELVLESDTKKIKIGDGSTPYESLLYYDETSEKFLGTITTITIW